MLFASTSIYDSMTLSIRTVGPPKCVHNCKAEIHMGYFYFDNGVGNCDISIM